MQAVPPPLAGAVVNNRTEALAAYEAVQELRRALTLDVASVLGVRGDPLLSHVTRWRDCMPQYTVGHLDRVATALTSLDGTPFVLAGAAFRGGGLPDCIAQGRSAAVRAREILESAVCARG